MRYQMNGLPFVIPQSVEKSIREYPEKCVCGFLLAYSHACIHACESTWLWNIRHFEWADTGKEPLVKTSYLLMRECPRMSTAVGLYLACLSFRCLCLLLILFKLYIAASSSDTGIRGPSDFMISWRVCAHVCAWVIQKLIFGFALWTRLITDSLLAAGMFISLQTRSFLQNTIHFQSMLQSFHN